MKQIIKTLLPSSCRSWLMDKWHYATHLHLIGWRWRLNFADRLLLEDVILRHIASTAEYQRVLFIGCDWYTRRYSEMFPRREFWTIEIDPAKARYGGPNHIVDGLQNLSRHAAADFFDVIIHTGVFGWGINSRELAEETFEQCRKCLKPGGLFVFGWDDVPERRPFDVLEECRALKHFEPVVFPPLCTDQHRVADSHLRHVFNFFTKHTS